MHCALGGIGTDGLHHERSIGRPLLLFAVNLHFDFAARGIHDGAGAFSVFVDVESGSFFEFLFGDAFFLDNGLVVHHALDAGALLRRHLGESVGRNGRHGWQSGHGKSHGNFPETFLDVEGRDIVGGPEGQRAKDNQGNKKLVSH